MSVKPNTLLAEALRVEVQHLQPVRQEAAANRAEFAERTPPTLRDLRGIAANLTVLYQGAEVSFQRIVQATKEGTPTGADWHRALLDQAARDVSGVRPAIIRAETRDALEPLRTFRHFVRHRYGFDLDWDQIEPLLSDAEKTAEHLFARSSGFH